MSNLGDISVSGVRLFQDVSTLAHLEDQESFRRHAVASGLEQWELNNGRGDKGFPSSLKLLDGKVWYVKGPNLVFFGRKFLRATPEEEILEVARGFDLVDISDYPKSSLYFEKHGVGIFVSVLRERFKHYSIWDLKSEMVWQARHRAGKKC